jgi:pimeloyl-ACP methyl ester carboxylesterase
MLINNREIHIETHGRPGDKPIIFLHHGLGSTHAWQGQISSFVDAGYHLVIYDRWGYGKSTPRLNLAVPSFADDLADLTMIIQTLDLQTVSLIGHSDGGSIALYYASKHPKTVDALVVVAAHIYLEPKMEPGIQKIRQAFENDPRFRKGMQRAHGEKYESTFYNWFNGWHNPDTLDWDMRPILRKVKCPTLVIQGKNDEHATPQHAMDIAEYIASAELWLVPGGRHMLPQEMGDEFNSSVLAFLKNVKNEGKVYVQKSSYRQSR